MKFSRASAGDRVLKKGNTGKEHAEAHEDQIRDSMTAHLCKLQKIQHVCAETSKRNPMQMLHMNKSLLKIGVVAVLNVAQISSIELGHVTA